MSRAQNERNKPAMTPTFQYQIDASLAADVGRRITRDGRIGEVCMMLQRPDGRIWCAAKHYYPGLIARLLTGGIHPGENSADALLREIAEETGLTPTRITPLFRVTYQSVVDFQTFAYLCQVDDTMPIVHDVTEQIAHFEALDAHQLRTRAAQLEALPAIHSADIGGTWHEWGVFRAVCHRTLSDLIIQG
jgi:8-oxo-dGTP pyrophosphatase MutT (NUDIX family)